MPTSDLRQGTEKTAMNQTGHLDSSDRLTGADRLRRHLASLLQTHSLVFTDSGRSALRLALRRWNGRGPCRVGLPAFACRAILQAVLAEKGVPFLIDSEGPRCSVSIPSLREAATRIDVFIMVHTFGLVSPVNEIREVCNSAGIMIIDDAAQSFGASYDGRPTSTLGDSGILSLGRSKSFHAAGGGILVLKEGEQVPYSGSYFDLGALVGYIIGSFSTSLGVSTSIWLDENDGIARIYSSLDRERGSNIPPIRLGLPSTSVGLALGSIPYAVQRQSASLTNFRLLRDELKNVPQLQLADELPGAVDAPIQFPALIDRAEQVARLTRDLRRLGIPAHRWYPNDLSAFPEFTEAGHTQADVNSAKKLASCLTHISIPPYPDSQRMLRIASAIRQCLT